MIGNVGETVNKTLELSIIKKSYGRADIYHHHAVGLESKGLRKMNWKLACCAFAMAVVAANSWRRGTRMDIPDRSRTVLGIVSPIQLRPEIVLIRRLNLSLH